MGTTHGTALPGETRRRGRFAAAGDRVSDRPTSWLLRTIRYILPAAVTIAGLVVMAMGSETDLEGGASIVSAGLAIFFLNWLFRVGVREIASATPRTPPGSTSTGTAAGRTEPLARPRGGPGRR